MKINGKIIEGPTPEVIVIPKGTEEFVFKALPVLNYDEFDKICPVPNPPEIMKPGGKKTLDYEDKAYDKLLTDWAMRKNDWTALQSLSVTEGLEWETVAEGDPDTWVNFRQELRIIFTEAEIMLITDLVNIANGLDQKKIDEATKRFLAGQAVPAKV